MKGYRFSKFIPKKAQGESDFQNLLDLFLQLISITGGDVSEALSWLTNLDQQYNITSGGYGIGDFIDELKDKGYIDDNNPDGKFDVRSKTGQEIRKAALEEIFGKLKKSGKGQHKTSHTGTGDEMGTDRRPFEFGDSLSQIAMTDSLRNAQINHGFGDVEVVGLLHVHVGEDHVVGLLHAHVRLSAVARSQSEQRRTGLNV